MAKQFIIVLLVFMLCEIMLALISLIQCSKSKEEYVARSKQKDRILRDYKLCYEVAIN